MALVSEIDRISNTTTFNGVSLLSAGTSVALQVGLDGSSTSRISFNTVDGSSSGIGLSSVAISTAASAQSALGAITSAIVCLCARAVAWTHRHIGGLAGDPDRIALMGHSAGAYNAVMLALDARVTDCNAAFFDVAHDFAGCIPGCHEVLRRQGLLEGTWCLDPNEKLSPGQSEEIDRVCREHADLADDAFVRANLARWLA